MSGNHISARVAVAAAVSISIIMAFLALNVVAPATAAHAVVLRSGPPAPPAPVITSTGKHVYQSGVAANYVGTPGRFTFSDSGPVTGYIYSFGSPTVGNPTPAGPDGTLTVAITPNTEFNLNLYVQAVNGSSPPSAPSLFVIETVARGNIATLAWWKLSSGHGSVAADSTGNERSAALSNGELFSCATSAAPDGYRCALGLDGHGDAQTSPSLLPTIYTGWNFTVSAWVNLARCSTSCIALSQDGTKVSMVTLGYRASCALDSHGCWVFAARTHDDATGPVEVALAPVGRRAPFGRWVQLTGVYSIVGPGLTLYVNGVQKAQSAVSSLALPGDGGTLRLGAAFGGAHGWDGKLSDACVFFNSLPQADVNTLYAGDAAHPHNGCAALFATYP